MGRSKNKRKFYFHQNAKGKKMVRFWIEDCRETRLKQGVVPDLEVLVTRIELEDDYRQMSQAATTDTPKNEAGGNLKDGETGLRKEKDSDARENQNNNETAEVSPRMKPVSEIDKTVEEEVHASGTEEPAKVESSADRDDEALPPNKDESSGITAENAKKSNVIIAVKRSKNTNRPYSRNYESVEDFRPLLNGDCGDGIINPFPKDEVPDKFWSQRRRLFTRFDEGIELDKESWYSVTPEAIANHIALRMVGANEQLTILDPFCGCGGNAIAFALRDEVDLVVAVDTDLSKLKNAATNARVYGIPPTKLVFIHGNACEALASFVKCKRVPVEDLAATGVSNTIKVSDYQLGGLDLLPTKIDAVFLSPPWGGVDYCSVGKRNYSLSCIKVLDENGTERDGDAVLALAANSVGQGLVAVFLPKNTNGVALGKSVVSVGYKDAMVLEQNVLNGKLKTVTAYLGL